MVIQTILNVLIFTEKGIKQAGEVELDVSEPLNERNEGNGLVM